MGAENDTFGPIGGKAGVVVGVEVGKKVGNGEITGETEGIDRETGFGDEFGPGKRGGNGRKRERKWWFLLLAEGLKGSEEEVGRVQC